MSMKQHIHTNKRIQFLAGFFTAGSKLCAGWKHKYQRAQDSYTNTLAIVVVYPDCLAEDRGSALHALHHLWPRVTRDHR